LAPTATEEIHAEAAEESAAFLVMQIQMAQIIRGREFALSFVDGLAVQATSTGFFRFKN
jgi:hypothetical protein